jgi:hypothetical protein
MSGFLQNFSPDRLTGERTHRPPGSIFDAGAAAEAEAEAGAGAGAYSSRSAFEAPGHNYCRTGDPAAVMDDNFRSILSQDGIILPPNVTETGPFCFVDATDPRVVAAGLSWPAARFTGKPSSELDRVVTVDCDGGGVVPASCGVPRCQLEPACVSPAASTPAPDASSREGRRTAVLLANGGFETWAPFTNLIGHVRLPGSATHPGTGETIKWTLRPPFPGPDGANPTVAPRYWNLCVLMKGDQTDGYGDVDPATNVTSFDLARYVSTIRDYTSAENWGACQFMATEYGVTARRGPGRAPSSEGGSTTTTSSSSSSSSSVQVELYNPSDPMKDLVATLSTQNGAVASLAPGVKHFVRAWVRCEAPAAATAGGGGGSAASGVVDVALAISHVQDRGTVRKLRNGRPYLEVLPLSEGSNVVRCEPGGAWTLLEAVAVVAPSAPAAREVRVEVVIAARGVGAGAAAPHSVVLVDDVTLEAETGAGDGGGVAASCGDGDEGVGGGADGVGGVVGGGQLTGGQQQCRRHPVNILYGLREEGGVVAGYSQMHALVMLAAQSLRCRPPEPRLVPADCPLIAGAFLPHITSADVTQELARYTDEQLAAHMGWDDPSARAPSSSSSSATSATSAAAAVAAALSIVREGLGPAVGLYKLNAVDP